MSIAIITNEPSNAIANFDWAFNYSSDTESPAFKESELSGPFSFTGDLPLAVDALPGTRVSVTRGSVIISSGKNRELIHVGETYVHDEHQTFTMTSYKGTEARVSFP